jgi:hypothetical protein
VARSNREAVFVGELRKSFHHWFPHGFFYKIPDVGGQGGEGFRFSVNRPFDLIMSVDGLTVAVEAKACPTKTYNTRLLRDCQKKGLTDYARSGSPAYVLVKSRHSVPARVLSCQVGTEWVDQKLGEENLVPRLPGLIDLRFMFQPASSLETRSTRYLDV